MNKNIRTAVVPSDETVSFGVVEPLHGSLYDLDRCCFHAPSAVLPHLQDETIMFSRLSLLTSGLPSQVVNHLRVLALGSPCPALDNVVLVLKLKDQLVLMTNFRARKVSC